MKTLILIAAVLATGAALIADASADTAQASAAQKPAVQLGSNAGVAR
jgi:hypothetical protein